jgi:hypothetical protein
VPDVDESVESRKAQTMHAKASSEVAKAASLRLGAGGSGAVKEASR